MSGPPRLGCADVVRWVVAGVLPAEDGERVRVGLLVGRPRHDQLRHVHRHRQRQGAIAQRGKAKQKRCDLRLVGLGLVVTRDGGIPLTWHAYRGDRPDVTQFPAMVDQLRGQYEGSAPRLGLQPRPLCPQALLARVARRAGQVRQSRK
jgi:hypothetical protein